MEAPYAPSQIIQQTIGMFLGAEKIASMGYWPALRSVNFAVDRYPVRGTL
jgi:hypothetical protein